MITPARYFDRSPEACQEAKNFCRLFGSMREAWLSDGVSASWMIWSLGLHAKNAARLARFAHKCAEVAGAVSARCPGCWRAKVTSAMSAAAARRATDHAYWLVSSQAAACADAAADASAAAVEAAAADYAIAAAVADKGIDLASRVCALSYAESDAYAAGRLAYSDERMRQCRHLRELFPTMFLSSKDNYEQ